MKRKYIKIRGEFKVSGMKGLKGTEPLKYLKFNFGGIEEFEKLGMKKKTRKKRK